jgi:hypothetical protein
MGGERGDAEGLEVLLGAGVVEVEDGEDVP